MVGFNRYFCVWCPPKHILKLVVHCPFGKSCHLMKVMGILLLQAISAKKPRSSAIVQKRFCGGEVWPVQHCFFETCLVACGTAEGKVA